MAHWGVAFANGPDYNWNESAGFFAAAAQHAGYPSFKVAADALERAAAALTDESPQRERDLVGALALLFEWPVTPTAAQRKVAYADAMQALAERPNYAADADVQALAADAVMSLAPWALYGADQAPTPVAVRAKAPLERGLAADPAHPYLCHLRVHLDEMGPRARFHWPSAEALRRTDATDAGHLLHMPSHLDIQVGDYSAAMQANREAISADLRQLARAPQRFSIYSGYVVHNMEFLAWAAMLAGNKGAALAAAGQIETFLDEARLASNPMLPAFFESYLATRPMVLVRFGLWEELLSLPLPEDAQLYLSRTLFLRFGRALAFGAKGDVAAGRAEQAAFAALLTPMEPDTRRKHNTTVAEHSGPIAAAVLEAELSYREGRLEASWAALADAVARYDAMPYDEPAGYLMPPRQTYAALLAEQGRLERAARLYEEDLGTFPKNVWSLAGLRLCLAGEAHAPRLREVEAALAAAEAAADVEVRASCACALESWGSGRRPAPE